MSELRLSRVEDPSHQDRAGRGHTSLNPISSQSLTVLFIHLDSACHSTSTRQSDESEAAETERSVRLPGPLPGVVPSPHSLSLLIAIETPGDGW